MTAPDAAAPDTDPAPDTDAGATPDVSADASDSQGGGATSPFAWSLGNDTVTVSWVTGAQGHRTWTLKTTHPLRDNDPASKQVSFSEVAGQPALHTGHPGVDAVYAMALHEVGQNSVSALTDAAFNQGKPVPCPCFATGAKWPWAWTRDTAYAVALGLADVAPTRSAATLLFKTAERKASLGGGGRQIVQDTGTGGSWPVSSDRVVWALGAEAVLARLEGKARADFAAKSLAALKHTLTEDRLVTFDPVDGLYRGEESFLDWREQSYPSWTPGNIAAIAGSKALSTNVLYWHAHKVTAALATEANDLATAKLHSDRAAALRTAILKAFVVPESPLLAAFVGDAFDPSPTRRYELLGNALAVRLGLLTASHATQVVAAWPMSPAGPPVQWPQDPAAPVYHNRAIWPFVTAWHALAAKRTGHAEALHRALRSLTRFAALNLSHMENLEFLTGKNWVADGALSGPVVNSRRQLWSVAGFIGAIHQGVFGLETSAAGVRWTPALPRATRQAWFGDAATLTLTGVSLRGKVHHVQLVLPPPAKGAQAGVGLYQVKSVSLNGKPVTPGAWVSPLAATNSWVITLVDPAQPQAQPLPSLPTSAAPASWMAPPEPTVSAPTLEQGKLKLTWQAVAGASGYDVFRDGALVAAGVQGTSWLDPQTDPALTAPCFAVATALGALRSHHSRGQCWWGATSQRVQLVGPWKLASDGQGGPAWTSTPAGPHLAKVTGGSVTAWHVRPKFTGPHWLQLRARNTQGGVTTGIAAARARVRVWRLSDDKLVASGVVVVPQGGTQSGFLPSTTVAATLSAAEAYRVTVDAGPGLPNMSGLDHYTSYVGGPGGGSKSFSSYDLGALVLLARAGAEVSHSPVLTPDAKDDLKKHAAGNQLVPGAQLAPWGRFALSWDARDLYVTVVSKAFEQGLKPFVLYVQGAAKGALPGAQTSQGLTYLNLTPKLPFAPDFAVAVRSQSDAGDGVGPWSGVFARTQAGWAQRSRFEPGVDVWLAADKHTMTVRVPRALVGAGAKLRMAGHVVWALPAHEWKAVVPSVAMPWKNAATGYVEVDLATGKWVVK